MIEPGKRVLKLGIQPYDIALGEITNQDREYATDLVADLLEADSLYEGAEVAAEWLRKVRYEAVMADREARGLAAGTA